MKIRFAVAPPFDPSNLASFGQAVDDLEQLGFDTVWLPDIPLGGQLDPLVGLSYAAGRTTRLKLGCDLVPIGRNPFTLAKSLAQIDAVSEGRLLLSFVSGIDQPGEREMLGIGRANRGRLMEEITPLLRTWWAGGTVTYRSEHFHFDGVASAGRPVQDPLEVWFGGSGPLALARVGHFADGWLGAAMTPPEAAEARTKMEKAAAEAGRTIDPEHFGLSIPYAEDGLDEATLRRTHARRPDIDVLTLVPTDPASLKELVARHVDAGLSKFVVRPTAPGSPRRDALARLADVVLPLQT